MMYCGNCGKEIPNDSTFCPDCGAKTGNTENGSAKIDSQKVKKVIRLFCPIIAVILVALIGIKVFSYIQSIPSEKEIQAVANNVQNDSLVASDGKWIYYDDNGLCKMRLKDGSKQTVVSSDISAEHMFFIGNNLYYYSFPGYYMLKGETGKDLGFSVFTENCIQFDGRNFYVTGMSNYDDGGVYSCKAGNTEAGKKLSDIHPTRLLLQGDYLYVMSNYSSINNLPNEYYGTWRINTNGKNAISLFDFCPNYLVFSGNQIFYTNEDRIVCSADLDGSNEMVFEGAVVNGGLNVSDHYIFFISAETKTIWRMDKDGNNLIELNNDSSGSLNIIDEWIFYENHDYDYEIYKMNFDGSYNQPIY